MRRIDNSQPQRPIKCNDISGILIAPEARSNVELPDLLTIWTTICTQRFIYYQQPLFSKEVQEKQHLTENHSVYGKGQSKSWLQ